MDINNYDKYKPLSYKTSGNYNTSHHGYFSNGNNVNNGNTGNNSNAFGYQYNYNNAFSQPNGPLIEQPQYANPNNTLQNNLNNNLLNEYNIEYHINIDSDDRKLDVYPDPYRYVVSFKALGKSVERRVKHIGPYNNGDGSVRIEEKIFDETPGPVISRGFKNVRAVKIDRVILSKQNIMKLIINQNVTIKKSDDSFIITNIDSTFEKKISKKSLDDSKCDVCCCCDCMCTLNDTYKYIILRVKELQTNHIYATNTYTSDNSFILYVDKNAGSNNNIWMAVYNTVSFPPSQLFNLERLSIEFFNKNGKPLAAFVVIEYNITINYEQKIYKSKQYLLFGTCDKTILSQIKNTYRSIHIFSISELFKYEIWFSKILQNLCKDFDDRDITKMFNTFTDDNQNIAREKIFLSLRDLDLQEVIKKYLTNNVFFNVIVAQNEISTMVKYED
ncbi:MAG: hypothetical protein Terrestrivirus3_219 [Terrestrivirus sp.]|uniref:Uncharacterized protein n=1 Tax=Terrestrivirus sp. TaxID=2487775 RepID=A0A3G4ZM63_9VIRU|nr:MAG: hypothetical protein Terrestrivirus3_219 [Terrestrivirus sp.]